MKQSEKLPDVGAGKNKRGIRIGIAIGVVLLLFVAFFWIRVRTCEEQCLFEFDPEIESIVGEEQTFAEKSTGEDGMSVTYVYSGDLREITSDSDSYTFRFTFSDYFMDTQVNGSIAYFSFDIPQKYCSGPCSSSVEELTDHLDESLNEVTEIEITYGVRELNIFERALFAWDRFRATFTDNTVDISSYTEVTSFDFRTVGQSELRDSCEAVAQPGVMLDVGVDLYNAIIGIFQNSGLLEKDVDGMEYSDDLYDRFIFFDYFKCDTCLNKCYGENNSSGGLDHVFYPMLGATLDSEGATIDDSVALGVLANSYGVDNLSNFEEFNDSSDGFPLDSDPAILWAYEPVCMPYLLSQKVGDESSLASDTYKKICYDRTLKDKNTRVEEFGPEITTFDDETMFEYLDLLFSDYDSFIQLPYVSDSASTANGLRVGTDSAIYGYENNEEDLVELGNKMIVWAAWNLVYRSDKESGGLNSFAIQHTFRELIEALLVKRTMADDPAVSASIDSTIEDVIEFVGGPEYFEKAYNVEADAIRPSMDIAERYLLSLDEVISFWVLGRDYFDEYMNDDVDTYIENWFYGHYLSGECGKMNRDYFVHYNSNGECVQHSVGIRTNVTTMLYLLIINDVR